MGNNYTLIFIKYHDEILLINRQKPFWMGRWNGIGGKIEDKETPLQAAIRETNEEAGLVIDNLELCGTVTWNYQINSGKMYCFYGEITNHNLKMPIATREGILDFKKLDWILHPDNFGLAENIPIFIKDFLAHHKFNYHCKYDDEGQLVAIISKGEE